MKTRTINQHEERMRSLLGWFIRLLGGLFAGLITGILIGILIGLAVFLVFN